MIQIMTGTKTWTKNKDKSKWNYSETCITPEISTDNSSRNTKVILGLDSWEFYSDLAFIGFLIEKIDIAYF